jgi:hypothetical protein
MGSERRPCTGGTFSSEGSRSPRWSTTTGDVCQAVTELAIELQIPIGTDDFHTLNRCLDNAIASAVTEYARLREVTTSGADVRRPWILCPRAAQPPQHRRPGVPGREERPGRHHRQHRRSAGAKFARLAELSRPVRAEVRLDSGRTTRSDCGSQTSSRRWRSRGPSMPPCRGLQFTVGPVESGATH